MEVRNQEPSDADKLAMLLAERDMQPKPPEFESKMFPPKKKKRVGVEGEIKKILQELTMVNQLEKICLYKVVYNILMTQIRY